jgi:hypothetical protein
LRPDCATSSSTFFFQATSLNVGEFGLAQSTSHISHNSTCGASATIKLLPKLSGVQIRQSPSTKSIKHPTTPMKEMPVMLSMLLEVNQHFSLDQLNDQPSRFCIILPLQCCEKSIEYVSNGLHCYW